MPGTEAVPTELLGRLLGEGYDVEVQLQGTSMGPFLRWGDVLILRAVDRPLAVGDVVAFVEAERLVVHRVVGRRGGRVETRGDTSAAADAPRAEADVLARVVGLERRGRRRRLGLGRAGRAIAWLSRRGWLRALAACRDTVRRAAGLPQGGIRPIVGPKKDI